MTVLTSIALAVLCLWALLEAKTSRPDGTLLRVHPYRRMLAFITPGRVHATVTFDTTVDAEPLLTYLSEAERRFGAHLTHAVVAACFSGLAETPRMNRFVAGSRLYQRKGEWVTFSMKRVRLDRRAKIAMVKTGLVPGETFRDLCVRLDTDIGEQRQDVRTHEDREYSLLDLLPRPALTAAVFLARTSNHYNLLPGWFIEGDALHTSIVVANLGSFGLGAATHHLYEWGNCPLFLVVGAVEEAAVVVDGAVVVRRRLPLRFSYDERIDDGLNAKFGIDAVVRVLADPRAELGCLAADGSDGFALDRRRETVDRVD